MFAAYPNSRPDPLTLSAYVDATALLTLEELRVQIDTAIARSPSFVPTAPELVYGRLEPASGYHLHLTPEERGRDALVTHREKLRERRRQLIELQAGELLGLIDRLAERSPP